LLLPLTIDHDSVRGAVSGSAVPITFNGDSVSGVFDAKAIVVEASESTARAASIAATVVFDSFILALV